MVVCELVRNFLEGKQLLQPERELQRNILAVSLQTKLVHALWPSVLPSPYTPHALRTFQLSIKRLPESLTRERRFLPLKK